MDNMFKYLIYIAAVLALSISCNSSSKTDSTVSENSENSEDLSAVTNDSTTIEDRQYLVKVGDMAPDFEMEIPGGDKIKLSDLRGKVVMLQFTASWCGVCRKEMPYIESEIWQKHKSNPEFAIFGIDRDEPAEKIAEMRKATGVTYPIGLDPNGDIFGLYAEKSAGITRNVIIDRDGRIVMLTRLFEMEEFNHMVEQINRLNES